MSSDTRHEGQGLRLAGVVTTMAETITALSAAVTAPARAAEPEIRMDAVSRIFRDHFHHGRPVPSIPTEVEDLYRIPVGHPHTALIVGLRQLATWMLQHPDVELPQPEAGWFTWPVLDFVEADAVTRVEKLAAALGVDVNSRGTVIYVKRDFAGIAFSAEYHLTQDTEVSPDENEPGCPGCGTTISPHVCTAEEPFKEATEPVVVVTGPPSSPDLDRAHAALPPGVLEELTRADAPIHADNFRLACKSKLILNHVWHRDGGRCRYCWRGPLFSPSVPQAQAGGSPAMFDHVDPGLPPHSQHGDPYANIALVCLPCHQQKAGRTPTEAGMVLRPSALQVPDQRGGTR